MCIRCTRMHVYSSLCLAQLDPSSRSAGSLMFLSLSQQTYCLKAQSTTNSNRNVLCLRFSSPAPPLLPSAPGDAT